METGGHLPPPLVHFTFLGRLGVPNPKKLREEANIFPTVPAAGPEATVGLPGDRSQGRKRGRGEVPSPQGCLLISAGCAGVSKWRSNGEKFNTC